MNWWWWTIYCIGESFLWLWNKGYVASVMDVANHPIIGNSLPALILSARLPFHSSNYFHLNNHWHFSLSILCLPEEQLPENINCKGHYCCWLIWYQSEVWKSVNCHSTCFKILSFQWFCWQSSKRFSIGPINWEVKEPKGGGGEMTISSTFPLFLIFISFYANLFNFPSPTCIV